MFLFGLAGGTPSGARRTGLDFPGKYCGKACEPERGRDWRGARSNGGGGRNPGKPGFGWSALRAGQKPPGF